MTEAKLERMAEKWMDTLDSLLMHGGITQETYDQEVYYLDLWVQQNLQKLKKNG